MTDLSEIISLSSAVLDAVRYEGVRHGSHSVSETLGYRFEEWAWTAAVQPAGELSPPSSVDTPVLTSLLTPPGTFPAPRLLGPAHSCQQQPGWCVHCHIHSASAATSGGDTCFLLGRWRHTFDAPTTTRYCLFYDYDDYDQCDNLDWTTLYNLNLKDILHIV